MTVHHKKDIATAQLGSAIALFVSKSDFISAITLAGAADAIFCGLLIKQGSGTFTDDIAKLDYQKTGHLATRSVIGRLVNDELKINALKHFNKDDPAEIEFDEELCALGAILKAVVNFYSLSGTHNPEILALVVYLKDNAEYFQGKGVNVDMINQPLNL